MNRKFKLLISTVLVSLIGITVFVAMKASNQGSELVTLQETAATLQEENRNLNSRIVSGSSLMEISKEASSSGFVTPTSFMYISGNGIALR